MGKKNPTLFLDRDGTINVDKTGGYVTDPGELMLIPRAAKALVRARNSGFKLAIITNQQGIAKGLYSEDDLKAIHLELVEQIRLETGDANFNFDRIEYCPHAASLNCECRKPRSEMVKRATRELFSDLSSSWYIGDKDADLLCAADAGVRSILVRTGYGLETENACQNWVSGKPAYIVDDLAEAIELILSTN